MFIFFVIKFLILIFPIHQHYIPLPPGWGLFDGMLALLLHTLSEVRAQ